MSRRPSTTPVHKAARKADLIIHPVRLRIIQAFGAGQQLTAQHVFALPRDVWAMPRLQPEGLPMISLGGLWLCLWRGPWRRWGVVAIAAGLTT